MTTLYTDGAGNKYIGDCRFGNHDINYPSNNHLYAANTSTLAGVFSDYRDLWTGIGFNNIFVKDSPLPNDAFSGTIMSFSPQVSSNVNIGFRIAQQAGSGLGHWNGYSANNGQVLGNNPSWWAYSNSHFRYEIAVGSAAHLQYSLMAGQNCFSHVLFSHDTNRLGFSTDFDFVYYGVLDNVNTNFSYYNNTANSTIIISRSFAAINANTYTTNLAGLGWNWNLAKHYVVGVNKDLLQTGDANYSVVCADAQTPTSQWATDMWVFDNNATLGYPAIGRVRNMLLGVGTFTFLKPVLIQGAVFPDGGSQYYLPVGTYGNKTLLSRCYSSVV